MKVLMNIGDKSEYSEYRITGVRTLYRNYRGEEKFINGRLVKRKKEKLQSNINMLYF